MTAGADSLRGRAHPDGGVAPIRVAAVAEGARMP